MTAPIIRLDSRETIPEALRGAILALGNFDGFHLGHQAVVGEAVQWARAEGRPAIVATFDPHPVRHFAPQAPPFRLTSLDQRQELFAGAGAQAMLVFHFDAALAATSAQDWVSEVLARHIGAAGVVTGADFTFGKGRAGNSAVLAELATAAGMAARAVAPVRAGGEEVSSSRIREALHAGDPATATRLMTRPFAVRGHVQPGAKQGRELGFATANLTMGPYLRPAYGVYAVRGRVLSGPLADGSVLDGVANFGIRPMFEAIELLEPHFFDFAGDLYGEEIEVTFEAFLRPEASFASIAALKEQIAQDCAEARKALGGGA